MKKISTIIIKIINNLWFTHKSSRPFISNWKVREIKLKLWNRRQRCRFTKRGSIPWNLSKNYLFLSHRKLHHTEQSIRKPKAPIFRRIRCCGVGGDFFLIKSLLLCYCRSTITDMKYAHFSPHWASASCIIPDNYVS